MIHGSPSAPVRHLARDAAWLLAVALVWAIGAALSRSWGIWPGIGGAALLLAGLLLAFHARPLAQTLAISPRTLALGAAAGILMILVTYALYPLGVRLFPALASETASLYGAFGTPSPARILLLIAVILAEELVWRGWAQGVLTHHLGLGRGTVLAAFIYALAHAPAGSPLLPLVALACGLGWGALRQGAGSLAASITAHLLWDLAILAVWPLTA